MKNNAAYSQDEKITIIREHEENHKTLKQICDEYGVSKSYLCYLLKQYRESGKSGISKTRYYSAEYKLKVVKRQSSDQHRYIPFLVLPRLQFGRPQSHRFQQKVAFG